MFSELAVRIHEHVGKKADLVVADFSTTGPVERAASEVVLFDAFQSYFEYDFMTMCGIPQITLLGTAEDWLRIRRRAEVLAEFDLTAWTTALLPVLDGIVRTAQGHVDRAFWESLYKRNNAPGGPYVTGWINVSKAFSAALGSMDASPAGAGAAGDVFLLGMRKTLAWGAHSVQQKWRRSLPGQVLCLPDARGPSSEPSPQIRRAFTAGPDGASPRIRRGHRG